MSGLFRLKYQTQSNVLKRSQGRAEIIYYEKRLLSMVIYPALVEAEGGKS